MRHGGCVRRPSRAVRRPSAWPAIAYNGGITAHSLLLAPFSCDTMFVIHNFECHRGRLAGEGRSDERRRLRRDSGHTANHVCDLLGRGRGKVGRFEANLWKRREVSDIRDLLRIYRVDEAAHEELE